MSDPSTTTTGNTLDRRQFIGKTAGIAAGLTIVPAHAVRGSRANSALRLGLVGCGGRGNFVLDRFKQAETNTRVVALADPFRDNAEKIRDRHAEKNTPIFGGLDGYKELLGADVDAVIITSPPYCHPEQTAAAVEAGKHVWCAKPIAVDTFGARQFIDAGRRARGKVSVFVDFQTRNSPAFQGAAARVCRGDIGTIVSGQVYYQAGRLGVRADPQDTSVTARLRNWVFDKALSGDIIVEQNVHVLDVSNWYVGKHPLKAYGTGGRKGRTDVGDCWDHFLVIYWYPDDIRIDFSSGQYLKGYSDLCIRMYGTEGTVDSHYGGDVRITGDKPWTGERENTYREPVLRNARDFEESIRSGQLLNNAEESATSTLTGILGRLAAYRGREVSWAEMMAENERLDLRLAL